MSMLRLAFAAVAVVGVGSGAAVAGDKDVAAAGSVAKAAVINVSEDTPINYVGGVPPGFSTALDADDSTFNRLTGSCATLSGVGTAVPFDTVTITNNSPGTANFVATSTAPGGGPCDGTRDTFFILYNGTFNPATPTANCLALNDDIAGAANRCSTLSFAIPVGQTRVLVTTGFNNAATANGLFSYDINFTGTTPVELMKFDIE